MRILAVGGGSGGHVTPVVAVLREIKKTSPNSEIKFWCDKKFFEQAAQIMSNFDKNIPIQSIVAGKFRRYHHLTVLRQLLWPSLVLQNFRDVFLVLVGFIQSFVKLLAWRPDVVFTKGGYVCLPVGFAAHLLRIPIVIHDSDAHPGLTNLILSRWAKKITTGAPLEYYPYPLNKTSYVGIPVASEFHQMSESDRRRAKEEWGIKTDRPLIVVTGGGLGASRINDTIALTLSELQKLGSVILISGNSQYDELRSITPPNSDIFQMHAFVSIGMATLLGAADVVVARAGATTILELASLKKPTILIPNGKLSGGHQLKNAAVYKEKQAAVVLDEDDMINNPKLLVDAIDNILSNPNKTDLMTKSFYQFARPNAARDVASIIIKSAKVNK